MTIRELIERLEKSEGPSPDLDREIWKTRPLPETFFGSRVTAQRFHGAVVDYETEDGFYHTDVARVPAYTASIDGALTLLPEDALWGIDNDCSQDKEKWHTAWCFGQEGDHGKPAIALCIAALKAREAQG